MSIMARTPALRTLLRARLAAFAGESRGSVTVEAVIMLPMLVWAYCALFTFFDAYRQTSISEKAAYTISDMLSRETNPIDDALLDGGYDMLSFLTRSNSERRMRVTVVRYDGDNDEYDVRWSQVRGSVTAYAEGPSADFVDRLPVMVNEEQIILVETWMDYSAPFDVGLGDQTVQTFIFTRPRFGQQICWEECQLL